MKYLAFVILLFFACFIIWHLAFLLFGIGAGVWHLLDVSNMTAINTSGSDVAKNTNKVFVLENGAGQVSPEIIRLKDKLSEADIMMGENEYDRARQLLIDAEPDALGADKQFPGQECSITESLKNTERLIEDGRMDEAQQEINRIRECLDENS
ncbi:MAG TPA: DUF4398 domain-containing protein [Pyrinomonadaceae bacterium]|jgi:hypothetical protein